MNASPPMKTLPRRIRVASVIEGRYQSAQTSGAVEASREFVPVLNRPLSWDARSAGTDTVSTAEGAIIKLNSTGMQSVPQPGWVLLLTSGDDSAGYSWTLYGLPSSAAATLHHT